MEIFGQIVMLLAGCGVFMLGFKLLSEHMEKLAGNGLKSFFNKVFNLTTQSHNIIPCCQICNWHLGDVFAF